MSARRRELRPMGPPAASWTSKNPGEPIVLTGQGAMVFPDRGLAMVADLHLGKTQTFRHHGLAIPEGSDEETLEKLETLLKAWPVQQLVVLGDLIHHSSSLDRHGRLLEKLRRFRSRWPDLAFHLVLGNHDRALEPAHNRPQAEELVAALDLKRHPETFVQHGIRGYHDPSEQAGLDILNPEDPQGESEPWQVCGHLHPTVRLQLGRGHWQRIPCFTRLGRQWMLPAFGAFTGSFAIEPNNYDEIVGLVEGELLAFA